MKLQAYLETKKKEHNTTNSDQTHSKTEAQQAVRTDSQDLTSQDSAAEEDLTLTTYSKHFLAEEEWADAKQQEEEMI